MAQRISGNIVDFQILNRLFKYLRPYKRQFVSVVLLTIALAVLTPIRPYLIQQTIDIDLSIRNFRGVVNMIFVMVGLLIVQTYLQYVHTYLSSWLGQSVIRDLRIKLFDHIQKLQLKFFDQTPIGKLVTRNVSDIETLSQVFSEGVAALIGDLLQLLAILAIMFWTDWRLALVSLATFPLLIFSTYVFKEKVKQSFNNVRNAVSNLNTFVQEHITGMNIVQIFNSEKREFEKFRAINEEHKKANLKAVLYYSVYFPVAEIIQATSIGLVVWFGAREVLHDSLTLGVLIAFIMYIQMFFRPIRMIADRFNTLQMGIVSSNRIFDLLDNDEHIMDNGIQCPQLFKGSLVFKDVWFAYNQEDYVLKDISFSVEAGQTVALVGATGAGKSSTINLLNRFYEVNKGKILVDGIDLRDFDLRYLRKKIGVVHQDVFLFSDTIENNISMGNPHITTDIIENAASHVGALEFIRKLPGGFQYNVQERGATLSVGQRQLISFVRAMVYDPKILILDEATSSVDTETEELIQEAIDKMMKGRTSVVIAHRLSTIKKADCILVFDKGEIKESGSHEKLLNMGGYYTQLHQMQYKVFA